MKIVSVILVLLVAFALTIAVAAQDEAVSGISISFEEGTCEAQASMATPYYLDSQQESSGSLDGGRYPVIEAVASSTELWLSIQAAEVADADLVWINANMWPVTLTTDCLYSTGYGAVEAAPSDSPPNATTSISYPYGGCLLQSTVGTPSHSSVQEAANGEITATQVIVLNVTVYQDNQWIGVYGGSLGLPVYVTPTEFIESNFTVLTASCLYIPMVASAL